MRPGALRRNRRAGIVDDRVDLRYRGFQGAWQVATRSGSPYTYPSDAPDREIDFVMIRPFGEVEVLEPRVVLETMAADHRPLLAVLCFPPALDGS